MPKDKFYERKQPPKHYSGKSKPGPNRRASDAASRVMREVGKTDDRAKAIAKRVGKFVGGLID